MLENLIVIVIVGAALYYAWRKWLRPAKKAGGCGSGCNTCDSCEQAPSPAPGNRVIMLRKAHD